MLVIINSENGDIEISNNVVLGMQVGTPVHITISASEAYNLYRRLQEKSNELYDLATNYYQCKDCDRVHHNTDKRCPSLESLED